MQPEVAAAAVDVEKATAVVWLTPEAKATKDWQKQLGEKLANHLTTCGFQSHLQAGDKLHFYSLVNPFTEIRSSFCAELQRLGRSCQLKHVVLSIALSLVPVFVSLTSHQPAVLFSQNKSAIGNQLTVLFFQNKSAPAISHQPKEQTALNHLILDIQAAALPSRQGPYVKTVPPV
jgi:hypothetical protein